MSIKTEYLDLEFSWRSNVILEVQLVLNSNHLDCHCSVSKQEVLNLLSMFTEEVKPKDKMDRTSFREILRTRFSMTDDMLMDRGNHFANHCHCWLSF